MEPKSKAAGRLIFRRGLALAEAALYVGLGSTLFLELVKARRMPQPRLAGTRRIWDTVELDTAFEDLPHEGETTSCPPPAPARTDWDRYRARRDKDRHA